MRLAAPRQRHRGGVLALCEVEADEAVANRLCDRRRIRIGRLQARIHHGQVAQREHGRVGDVDRVAAELDAELRRPQHGCADTFAERHRLSGQAPLLGRGVQRLGQIGPQITVARRLATVDVLGHAAREGQRCRPVAVQDQRLGQQKGSAHLGRLLAADVVDQDVGQRPGQAAAVVCRQPRAQAQRNAELLGDQPGGRLDAREALVDVEGHQASADVQRSGRQHFAIV